MALLAAALMADGAAVPPCGPGSWPGSRRLVGDVALLLDDRWLSSASGPSCSPTWPTSVDGELDLAWSWGVLIVVIAVLLVGPRLLTAVKAGHPTMLVPVLCYLVVISAMAITAWCTGSRG